MEPDLSIRPAGPDELESLLTIEDDASGTAWGAGRLRAALSADPGGRDRVLVCERRGDPCGFLVYSLVLDEASLLYITVAPRWRSCGVGRALLVAGLEAMRRDGARTCMLEVRESNLPARRLYQALDFRLDGRRRNYYGTPEGREDALLMSLAL